MDLNIATIPWTKLSVLLPLILSGGYNYEAWQTSRTRDEKRNSAVCSETYFRENNLCKATKIFAGLHTAPHIKFVTPSKILSALIKSSPWLYRECNTQRKTDAYSYLFQTLPKNKQTAGRANTETEYCGNIAITYPSESTLLLGIWTVGLSPLQHFHKVASIHGHHHLSSMFKEAWKYIDQGILGHQYFEGTINYIHVPAT